MNINEKMYDITTECVAYKDNILYSVGREMNILFLMNLEKNKVETMIDMPDENNFTERLYNGICIEGDRLVLVPFNAKKLWIYNFSVKKWSDIDIGLYLDSKMQGKFVGGILNRDIIYLFGYKYHGILTINLNTKEIRELLTGRDKGRHAFWGQSIAVCGEKVYIASSLASEIICIHLAENDYEVIPLDDNLVTHGSYNEAAIIYSNNAFYIKQLCGDAFYEWIPFEKLKELRLDSFYDSKESFFNGIAATGKYVLFYSPQGKSYVYDCENPQASYFWEEKIFYATYLPDIGTVICKKGTIIVCDELLHAKSNFEISIDEKIHRDYLKNSKITLEFINENSYMGAKDFINLIETM